MIKVVARNKQVFSSLVNYGAQIVGTNTLGVPDAIVSDMKTTISSSLLFTVCGNSKSYYVVKDTCVDEKPVFFTCPVCGGAGNTRSIENEFKNLGAHVVVNSNESCPVCKGKGTVLRKKQRPAR
jgi:DnaJ-class molecular chaperone